MNTHAAADWRAVHAVPPPLLLLVASDLEEAYARARAQGRRRSYAPEDSTEFWDIPLARWRRSWIDRRDATEGREGGREEGGELGSLRGPPSPSSALALARIVATYAMPARSRHAISPSPSPSLPMVAVATPPAHAARPSIQPLHLPWYHVIVCDGRRSNLRIELKKAQHNQTTYPTAGLVNVGIAD